MTIQIFPVVLNANAIEVFVRAEGPGGLLGDTIEEVRRGTNGFGYTYDELRAAAEGGPELFWPRTDGKPEVTPT